MSPIGQLQNYLAEGKLSAFLVLTKMNRQYLSGFTGSAGALLVKQNDAELYVDDRYTLRARRESDFKVHPLTRLGADLSRKGRGKTGIEDKITLREFIKLQKMTRRIEVTSNVIENIRAVKSAQEIKFIAKGSRIIDEIFKQLVKMLKKNNAPQPPLKLRGGEGELSEQDLALEIGRLAKRLGGDGLAFDPIVAWGANAASPHHFSGNRKIGKNNFLLLDFGVLVKGYHSDFTRTLFVGKPNRRQEKIYRTVLSAQEIAIEGIKNGIRASHIDELARRFIGQEGFGKYFTHNTGHGVGLEIHELPNFSPDSTDILKKDMIVTVEPGIYIPGFGGVRIEDMVIIRDEPIALSKVGKQLEEMIV